MPDNRARGLLTDKRAQGLYIASRYGYCVVFVANGELIAVGVAMGGEDVVEIDDERTVALEDALLIGICKDRSQCGAQLSVLDKVIVEKVNIYKVFLSLGIKEVRQRQREVVATHRCVAKGYRLRGLYVYVFRQQFSQTRAQPLLIFQGHDGERDGNAEEQGGIEIGQEKLERNRVGKPEDAEYAVA